MGGGYTTRKFGPRPGSVALALSVQSRASWLGITASHSAEQEPRRTGNPTILGFSFAVAAAAAAAAALSCLYRTVPQALKLSTLWQPLCTTAAAPQALKLSTLWQPLVQQQPHINFFLL